MPRRSCPGDVREREPAARIFSYTLQAASCAPSRVAYAPWRLKSVASANRKSLLNDLRAASNDPPGNQKSPYRRQQTSPRPAPRPFVWTAQVAVVGQGVGSSAPLIIAPSPVARHTVATILARGFSHLLGRRGGGFIRVADCWRRYDRTCSVRGIEGCRR